MAVDQLTNRSVEVKVAPALEEEVARGGRPRRTPEATEAGGSEAEIQREITFQQWGEGETAGKSKAADGTVDLADLNAADYEKYLETGELPEAKTPPPPKPKTEAPTRNHVEARAALESTLQSELGADLDEVIQAAAPIMASAGLLHYLGDALADSTNPTGIFRELVSNPEIVKKMERLSPREILKEIDAIDKRIEEGKPRRVTRASRPPSEVGGRMAANRDIVKDAINNDDYEAFKDEEDRRDVARYNFKGRR